MARFTVWYTFVDIAPSSAAMMFNERRGAFAAAAHKNKRTHAYKSLTHRFGRIPLQSLISA